MVNTLGDLAPELISNILAQVHESGCKGGSGLFNCLFVCKRWRDEGLAILYRSLALDNDRLCRLKAGFDEAAVSNITRYLTVRITWPGHSMAPFDPKYTPGLQYADVEEWLSFLSGKLLPAAVSLVGFSFSTDGCASPSAISTLLQMLPPSCTDLEILRDRYWFTLTPPPEHHMCHDLRRLLPRLHRVHLRLGEICGDIVGSTDQNGNFLPVGLPSMQHLLVDCIFGLNISELCEKPRQSVRQESKAWHSVIEALRQVSLLPQTNAEIVVMGARMWEEQLVDHASTAFRCHIADGRVSTAAFPIDQVAVPKGTKLWPMYIRTDRGDYVVTGHDNIRRVCRPAWYKRSWFSIQDENGPGLFSTSAAGNIWTEEQWRQMYPRSMAILWGNERRTGMRLIDAEVRQDAELNRVVQHTPKGWHKLSLTNQLEKDGEP